MAGALIAIEGTDGSGKSTLARGVAARLGGLGHRVVALHFPDYDEPATGHVVARFLRGELGADVAPELVAMLFAVNRAARADDLRALMRDGAVVVCDRYVLSNVAFQAAKVADVGRAAALGAWIEALEHELLGSPRPTVSLWLDVPPGREPGAGDPARGHREYLAGAADIHEADTALQRAVHAVYASLASSREDVLRLDALADGTLLGPDALVDRAVGLLKPLVS